MVLRKVWMGEAEGITRTSIMLHIMTWGFWTSIVLTYLILKLLWKRYIFLSLVKLNGRLLFQCLLCCQQVERVLSRPDVYAIERAKELLIVSWFSLFPLVAPKRIWTGEATVRSFLKSWCILLSLQGQEQSLLDAIAKLDEASDHESGKLPWIARFHECSI